MRYELRWRAVSDDGEKEWELVAPFTLEPEGSAQVIAEEAIRTLVDAVRRRGVFPKVPADEDIASNCTISLSWLGFDEEKQPAEMTETLYVPGRDPVETVVQSNDL